MIDDYDSAMALKDKLEQHLPIPAKPGPALVRLMKEHGAKIRPEHILFIQRVFYSGDEGGIMCAVTPAKGAKEAYVVSLTHFRIPMGHPLYLEIRAYQQQRTRRLREEDQGFRRGG